MVGVECRRLEVGMSGEDVARWERELLRCRLWDQVVGVYGEDTAQATRSWQTQRGLKPTGVVGEAEWEKLEHGEAL